MNERNPRFTFVFVYFSDADLTEAENGVAGMGYDDGLPSPSPMADELNPDAPRSYDFASSAFRMSFTPRELIEALAYIEDESELLQGDRFGDVAPRWSAEESYLSLAAWLSKGGQNESSELTNPDVDACFASALITARLLSNIKGGFNTVNDLGEACDVLEMYDRLEMAYTVKG